MLRGSQKATFSYFRYRPERHAREKVYEILVNIPREVKDPAFQRSNQEFEEHTVVVEDVRGHETEFNLDVQGACWRTWEGPATWKDLDGTMLQEAGHDAIRHAYLPQVEEFIRDELNKDGQGEVDFVKVFDYKLRLSMPKAEFERRTIDLEDGLDAMIPVTHPHVDQSFNGAIQRVKYHMPDEAPELLTRRFRIVNVWKPLKPVKSWPLAICDSRTVDIGDLIPSDLVRRRFLGETFYAKYSIRHRWHYLSHQQPNEVTMLKIYDSNPDAPVKFCLHSGFQYATVDESERRESFEVRALVFDKA